MHPVLFKIGSRVIDTYTVAWTLCLAFALAWTRNRASRLYGMDDENVRFALFWGFLGILAGARLGHIAVNWQDYAREPAKLLRFWEGGLSALPAILGGGLAALAALRRSKLPLWPLAESASLPAAALVAVGRWGCLAEGCCYGKVTDVPWGIHFPFDPAGVARHPTQAYESLSALFLLLVLAFLERKIGGGNRKAKQAVLWPLFLAGYGLIRLAVEPLRGEPVMGTLAARSWSLGVFLLGAAWLAVSVFRSRKDQPAGEGIR